MILERHNINFETQKQFDNCKYIKNLYFDFYLPNYNLCIEYDGKVSKNSFLFASTNQFLFYPINCSNLNVLENEFKKKDINLFLSKSYYSHYAYNVIFDKNDNSVRVYQFRNKK